MTNGNKFVDITGFLTVKMSATINSQTDYNHYVGVLAEYDNRTLNLTNHCFPEISHFFAEY